MKKNIYIFFLLLSNLSIAQQLMPLIREVSNENEHYGWSMDSNDDFLVIGSPHSTTDKGKNAGKVHLYQKLEDSWIEYQEIQDEHGDSFENFGFSVAIYGKWLAVGAVGSFDYGPFTGKVNLYYFNGTTFEYQKTILPPTVSANQWFGHTIVMNNTTLAISAINADGVNKNSGNVFVYNQYSTTTEQVTSLADVNIPTNSHFGFSMDLSDENNLIVGAPDRDGEEHSEGAAYLYSYNNDWILQKELVEEEKGLSHQFGYSVQINSHFLVIGSLMSDGINQSSGVVYSYKREGNTLDNPQKIYTEEGRPGDSFGQEIFLKEDQLIIGAPKVKIENANHAGEVYYYSLQSNKWYFTKSIMEPIPKEGNHFGAVLTEMDGAMIITAKLDDSLSQDAGQVYYESMEITALNNVVSEEQVNVYPIPTSETVTITYQLFSSEIVELGIYDSNGGLVKKIIDGEQQFSGDYDIKWDLTSSYNQRVSNGLYFYKLKYNKTTFSGKIIVD